MARAGPHEDLRAPERSRGGHPQLQARSEDNHPAPGRRGLAREESVRDRGASVSGPGDGVPSPTPDLPLSEPHRRMLLKGSGIDAGVAEARGCRTVEKKVELEKL